MSYTVEWHTPGKIVLIKLMKGITDDEFKTMDDEVMGYFEHKTNPLLHVILDTTGVGDLPNLKVMTSGKSGRHPYLGWNIVVGELNAMHSFVATLVSQVTRIRFRHFETIDEAIEFLYKMDANLDLDRESIQS